MGALTFLFLGIGFVAIWADAPLAAFVAFMLAVLVHFAIPTERRK